MDQYVAIKVHPSVRDSNSPGGILMFTRFHGIDLHKRYATISVRDELGKEIQVILKCIDFTAYVESLSDDDIVVLESLNNAFYWADQIELRGATCVIIDPQKFSIIRESWSKTDRKDAGSLSLALWMSVSRNEFKLPTVDKPSPVIRDLRRLFAEYQMLNEQIRQYKNVIQGHLLETGIALAEKTKERLLKPQHGLEIFGTLDLPHTIQMCVIMNLYLLWNLFEQKEILKREIFKAGISLEPHMKRLITIKGVTPFLALAFLADVGDITRFSSARKLNAYLGVVPTVRASGGKATIGHINKRSRSLSRGLFSQIMFHFANSSPDMLTFYESTKARRGAGRSRIAVLRRLFSIMRRMLLDDIDYRWKDDINVHNKLVDYAAEMKNIEILAGSA